MSPSEPETRQRLDLALVARGLASTRARARDLIKRGEVRVNGRKTTRPAQLIANDMTVDLKDGAATYVSRGALKLRAALDHFAFEAKGRVALDVGASTGGFTETLLDAGAARVYAVENGRDQLHAVLKGDPRVVSLEGQDARQLDAVLIPEPIGALVADVSFISLTKALPAALALAADGCWLTALIKPQFELSPGQIGRGGIVRRMEDHQAAADAVTTWLASQPGWRVRGVTASPIRGGDGNVEFLMGAVHGD